MGVEYDFLIAFALFHRDPKLRPALFAALNEWSQSDRDLIAHLRIQPGVSSRDIVELENILRGRVDQFGGNLFLAFGSLFRSFFQHQNRGSAKGFFGALLSEDATFTEQSNVAFRRDRVHAMGGLGQVWLAYDSVLQRRVALKEVRSDKVQYGELVKRFLREARITGRLEHPNIVPVHQLVVPGPNAATSPYYTMRFVEGRTLLAEIRAFHDGRVNGGYDRLAFNRLLDVFVKTCQAIAYAHVQGVLHRDLKPENVLVGSFGEAVVVDWGLAKVIRRDDAGVPVKDSSPAPDAGPADEEVPETRLGNVEVDETKDDLAETQSGSAIGTPVYMAPEQAAGETKSIAEPTDIYGLGGILFYILTNQPPHQRNDGEKVGDFFRRLATHPARRPRDVDPKVSRILDAICARAMALAPKDRYSSAEDLSADIERWRAGEPILGTKPTWTERLARGLRRNQRTAVVVGGLFFVVALTAGIAWNHAAVSNLDVSQQQILDSRAAVQVFSLELLRSAERLAADVRLLGEIASVVQLIDARRRADAANVVAAEGRVRESLRAFVSRSRNLTQVSVVDLAGDPAELASVQREGDQFVVGDHPTTADIIASAKAGAAEFARLGRDRAFLAKLYLVADPSRPADQVWPRLRLVAPAGAELAGGQAAIVLDAKFGVLDPVFMPAAWKTHDHEEDTDWFLMNDAGLVLWTDPGRYFFSNEVPVGGSVEHAMPELKPLFGPKETAPEEVAAEQSGQADSAVFAQKIEFDYFRPPLRLVVAASTPREAILAANSRRQSSLIQTAAIVAVAGLIVALAVVAFVSAVTRRLTRSFG